MTLPMVAQSLTDQVLTIRACGGGTTLVPCTHINEQKRAEVAQGSVRRWHTIKSLIDKTSMILNLRDRTAGQNFV